MTRGKYADRAEKTRATNDALSQSAALTARNAELTKTIDDLRSEAERSRQQHDSVVARLQRQVAEGTSTELSAAQSEVVDLRTRLGEANAARDRAERRWKLVGDRLLNWLASQMPLLDAWETLYVILDEEQVKIVSNSGELAAVEKLGDEGLMRIQRARGQRK